MFLLYTFIKIQKMDSFIFYLVKKLEIFDHDTHSLFS